MERWVMAVGVPTAGTSDGEAVGGGVEDLAMWVVGIGVGASGVSVPQAARAASSRDANIVRSMIISKRVPTDVWTELLFRGA